MEKLIKFISVVFAFVSISQLSFAQEDIKIAPDITMTIVIPNGWQKESVSGLRNTVGGWSKSSSSKPRDFFILIKAGSAQEMQVSDTKQLTSLTSLTYFEQNEKIVGVKGKPSEEVTINGIPWGKIITETPVGMGVILRTETYCLVRNNSATQVRIMGPKKNWPEISQDIQPLLESIVFK